MFYIMFTNNAQINIWETVETKTELKDKLEYIRSTLNVPENKIHVFENPVELKNIFGDN